MTDEMPEAVAQHREQIRQLLATHGVTDTWGVELLRLIKMTANAYEAIMAAQMRAESLSAPRWRLLMRLYSEEHLGHDALSPTQLSQVQDVSKNTISALLRSLEGQGLIERSLDPQDRRRFQIKLSDTGRALIQTKTPIHLAFLNALLGDLSPAECAQLASLLYKLHNSLLHHARCGNRTEDQD